MNAPRRAPAWAGSSTTSGRPCWTWCTATPSGRATSAAWSSTTRSTSRCCRRTRWCSAWASTSPAQVAALLRRARAGSGPPGWCCARRSPLDRRGPRGRGRERGGAARPEPGRAVGPPGRDAALAARRGRRRRRPSRSRSAGCPSGDLFAVANAVASLLDAPITIEDRNSRVLAFSGRQDEADPSRVETILGRQVPERYSRILNERGVFRELLPQRPAGLHRARPTRRRLLRCRAWRSPYARATRCWARSGPR